MSWRDLYEKCGRTGASIAFASDELVSRLFPESSEGGVGIYSGQDMCRIGVHRGRRWWYQVVSGQRIGTCGHEYMWTDRVGVGERVGSVGLSTYTRDPGLLACLLVFALASHDAG